MCLKKPLLYKNQIQKLREHNLIVNDDIFAEQILSQTNYYRLTGYGIQFRKDPNKSDFISGIKIENLYELFKFDQELRGLLLSYLDVIEGLFRTRISYYASLSICNLPPYNQHYNRNNYYNKHIFDGIVKSIEREHGYYKDTLIIQHHDKKYQGQMPLWVWVNIMSFSNLSKYYTCLPYDIQDEIAKSVNSDRKALKNHLHGLSVLRNKSAHGARIYNYHFTPRIKLEKSFLKNNPETSNDSLFAYIYTLAKYLINEQNKLFFIEKLDQLILKYINNLDLSLIGFKPNWYELLTC